MEQEGNKEEHVKTDIKDHGVVAYTDPEDEEGSKVLLKYNPDTNYLDYHTKGDLKHVDLFKYQYSTPIDTDDQIALKIHLADTNTFLSNTWSLYFFDKDKRVKLQEFLELNHKEQKSLAYVNDLTRCFQNREFAAIQDSEKASQTNTIHPRKVKEFFQNAGIAHIINIPKNGCNQEEWRNIHDRVMSSSSSDILMNIFQKFASSFTRKIRISNLCTTIYYMTPENLSNFLKTYQKEEEDRSHEELTDIMQKHKEKEKSLSSRNIPDGSWNYKEFCSFLLSESNDIINPKELQVNQDMTHPLSHYWINSSYRTYLKTGQIHDGACVESYETALRNGVRYIELDVCNGDMQEGKLIPYVCNNSEFGATANRERLDLVLQTIHEHAFKVSNYPVIISLEDNCCMTNQVACANLFKDILGESLITEAIDQNEVELPSPERLKNKFLLMARTTFDLNFNAQEKGECTKDILIGNVWFKEIGKDKVWRQREMFWNKENISLRALRQISETEIFSKPYFVGFVNKVSIENFIDGHQGKEKGNYLIRSNESYNKFTLTVVTGCNPKTKGKLHLPICYEKEKYFLDNYIDINDKFESIDELIDFFHIHKISNIIKLRNPLDLRGSMIHKENDWFCGNIDADVCTTVMQSVKKKGSFLVRKEGTEHNDIFIIEYYDGVSHQSLKIEKGTEDKFSVPDYPFCKSLFDTVTQAVIHYQFFHVLNNATRLTEPLHLIGELLDDKEDDEETIKEGDQSPIFIRRKTGAQFIDDKDRKIDESRLSLIHTENKWTNIASKALDRERNFCLQDMLIGKTKLDDLSPSLQHIVQSQNEKIILTSKNNVTIEITTDNDVDVLYDALQSKALNKRLGSVSSTAIVNRGLCTEMKSLMVYCQVRSGGIDIERVKRSITYLKMKKGALNLQQVAKTSAFEDCMDYNSISSLRHDIMMGVILEGETTMREYHQNIMTKVFPQYDNYNPIPLWNVGTQIAALNLQKCGQHQQTNNAMFSANGGCGYVLKPQTLIPNKNNGCLVLLKIIEGRHLMTVKPPKEQLQEPHIKVSIEGVEDDGKKDFWDTAIQPIKPVITAFHSIWDADFKKKDEYVAEDNPEPTFLQSHVVHNRELAFIKFSLSQVDEFHNSTPEAQCTVKLSSIRNGLRSIIFKNKREDMKFPLAVALVDIQVLTMAQLEDKRKNIVDKLENIAYNLRIPTLTEAEFAEQNKAKEDFTHELMEIMSMKANLEEGLLQKIQRREQVNSETIRRQTVLEEMGFS